MEDFWFKIKVSDLLLNPGQKDETLFKNKRVKSITNISKEGISGKVILQSLDTKTISAKIKDLKWKMSHTCDICWKLFDKDFIVDNYETTFVLPEIHHDMTEKIHDEEFLINTKDESIDLEEVITHAIWETRPIVEKCESCVKQNKDEIDDYEEPSFESWDSIKWIKIDK